MGLLDLLLRPLRSPVVTGRYPGASDVPDRRHRGTPTLDPSRCDASGGCVSSCPTAAIALSDRGDGTSLWSLDYGRCVFCGRCVEACPANAIVPTGEFELAARRREDVIAVHVVRKGP